MTKSDWILNNIEIIKKDFHSAREERNGFGDPDLFLYHQNLEHLIDITLHLRQCFGVLFDASIIFVKLDPLNKIIFILRNHQFQNLDPFQPPIFEVYSQETCENLDFDSYGNKDHFLYFIQNCIEHIIDITDMINNSCIKLERFFEYNQGLIDNYWQIPPEFIIFLELFGNNLQAYKWHSEKYRLLTLENDWHNQSHAFFSVLKDLKKVADAYEPIVKKELRKVIIQNLKKSRTFHIDDDTPPQNMWELAGYLTSNVSFELALSDIENEVLRCFENLEEQKQLLIHYYVFPYQSWELAIDEDISNIANYTTEDLSLYLRSLSQELTHQAHSEWNVTH